MHSDQDEKYRNLEEASTKQRATLLGLGYLDSRGISQAAALISGVLSLEEMYKGKLVPLQAGTDEQPYVFAVTSGTPQSVMTAMKKSYNDNGHVVDYLLISDLGYREFMARYDPPKEVHYDDVKIAQEGDSDTIKSVSQTLEGVSSDSILDYLIDQADHLGASDIHIENQRDGVRIRLRVDGALHAVATISHEKYRILQGALASRSNISTAAPEPQTGHMQRQSAKDGKLLNMRIETVQTAYGMDAVIRLFNFDESMLQLDKLGLTQATYDKLQDVIKHPHGLVLVVGPTGSGKSTTLFSVINALNEPTRKILTLEDPIEITVPGIVQIPVNTGGGANFAENLRAVLRLDPDVVMVGEIRDTDTAKTAIQASITGHLVLSTFHAGSAAAAFTRIIDMIGQNPIFANAIQMVLAQRLVRKLDDATKIPYEPDEATKTWIRDSLSNLPSDVEKPNLDTVTLYKPGITADSPFGYKGRIMLMEQLLVTGEIGRLIRADMKDIDVVEIEKSAIAGGMMTMLHDGLLKCLRGETTIEEVNRVL
ncbi:MAG TPA: ATPase, T2SS/T4P/T4SS family [Candidatus Saccharimonadales bacterium]|jgi:type II secretory ATPase GspE/PulE/Tfp pilus assembly ATPase PilB-like protein